MEKAEFPFGQNPEQGFLTSCVRQALKSPHPAAETERLTTRICLDEPLRAPVSAGKTVGAAVFCLNGTEIGRVPLGAGRTVMPKVSSALAGLKLELKDE